MIKTLTSPKLNYIIPLTNIFEKNNTSIMHIINSFMTRGYAFIRLPQILITLIDNCIDPINNFFNLSQQAKKMYFKKPIFGYFSVDHKESFRLLTGSRLKEHLLPKQFDHIIKLSKIMDEYMHKLVKIFEPYIFPNLSNYNHDIPLVNNNDDNKWAMFDITKYYNNNIRIDHNCKEHFDPGLLSMSIRSTSQDYN